MIALIRVRVQRDHDTTHEGFLVFVVIVIVDLFFLLLFLLSPLSVRLVDSYHPLASHRILADRFDLRRCIHTHLHLSLFSQSYKNRINHEVHSCLPLCNDVERCCILRWWHVPDGRSKGCTGGDGCRCRHARKGNHRL